MGAAGRSYLCKPPSPAGLSYPGRIPAVERAVDYPEGIADELGTHFWWKTAGLVVGIGVLLLLGFLIFNGLYYRLGAVGAFVVISAVAIAFGYRSDKKKQREYDE
jgi:hypothetical protein